MKANLMRPIHAAADCDPTHRRWLEPTRLGLIRRARGLSLEQAVERILENGDGTDHGPVNTWNLVPEALALMERDRLDPPAHVLVAAASAYGVPLEAFTICATCRDRMVEALDTRRRCGMAGVAG